MSKPLPHPVDAWLPWWKLGAYGFQHVLTFYAGAVIVPILLASALGFPRDILERLITADLFTCGIATLLQTVGIGPIGARLPLLQGVTFTAVAPMIAIGTGAGSATEGLLVIYGAVIASGFFTLLAAPFFARMLRFFPPIVTGSVILVIGLALLPVAANDILPPAGGGIDAARGVAYGLGTLACIVAVQRLFKGFIATIAVLIGLLCGTVAAWALGDAHFGAVGAAPLLAYTKPFFFGLPKFQVMPILSMIVVMMITMLETTGDVLAVGVIVKRPITPGDIARAIRADGLATVIGGVFNSFPYTCFAENVGLVRLTQVKSRWVVAAAAVIMLVLGCLPRLAVVVASVPLPVLGGAALAMFGTVAAVGIQTLSRVDFENDSNIITVATSVGLAALVTAQPHIADVFPAWTHVVLGSGITLGALAAVALNLIFGGRRKSEEAAADAAGIPALESLPMAREAG